MPLPYEIAVIIIIVKAHLCVSMVSLVLAHGSKVPFPDTQSKTPKAHVIILP